MKALLKTTLLAVASLAVFASAQDAVIEGGNPGERFIIVETAEPTSIFDESIVPSGEEAPLASDRGDVSRFQEFIGHPPITLEGAARRLTKNAGGKVLVAISLPKKVQEGGPAGKAYIKMSRPLKVAAKFTMGNSSSEQMLVPQSCVIAAGRTLGSFSISAKNDKLVNLTRDVFISVSIAGTPLARQPVKITDDEIPPKMKLVLPGRLVESGVSWGVVWGKNASIVLDKPVDVPFTVHLDADVAGRLEFPDDLMLRSGQTRFAFKVTAMDDDLIDGLVPVTLTASCEGLQSGKGAIIIADSDARGMTLVPPVMVLEGGTATGTVKVSGTMGYELEVALASDSNDRITLPASVKIPVGSSEATFTIGGLDNVSRDGSREVVLTASAVGFGGSNANTVVRDNELCSYRIGGLGDILNIGLPAHAVIFGTDVEGNDILNFSGTVALEFILPDGTVEPAVPAAVTLDSSAGWTGNLTLPPVSSAPLRVRATDAAGVSGESAPCDVMRVLPMTAQNLVWDERRHRIFASATQFAGALYENQLVAIDPETLQVTGSGRSNGNPGGLILTGRGEFLYQACSSNGLIYKFDPDTLRILSQFSAGNDADARKLYAADLCPMEGAPDSVVVSRYYGGKTNYNHHSVAIFDNGVMRPVTTDTYPHSYNNVIEPSSDPSVFFGYNVEGSGFELMRLQSSASGITTVTSKSDLLSGFNEDIRSYGNRIFSTTGIVVDGGTMKRLRRFDYRGLVFPDPVSARVYYLENPSVVYGSYQSIAAYDPVSLGLIQRLALPANEPEVSNLIRCGRNGIAYLTRDRLVIINSTQLVPSEAAADLGATIGAAPGAAIIGVPMTYTVQVANAGPNVARNVRINAVLSDGQVLQNAVGSVGVPLPDGSVVTLSAGDIAVNDSVTLTLTTVPQSAGQISCNAALVVDSLDSLIADNSAVRNVKVDFKPGTDEFKPFKLDANNLVNDPGRGVFWASLSKVSGESLQNMVVSFNPSNGDISAPIPLDGDPVAQSMALSGNGRYLYLGLVNQNVVQRIDLDANPPARVLIPLSRDQYDWTAPASQIQVLDGDGTSIVIATGTLPSIIVVDGLTKRWLPDISGFAPNIEKTSKPGVFISYNKNSDANKVEEITVSPASVVTTRSVPNLVSGYRVDIRGDGRFLLSSSGRLIDSDALTLIADLGMVGRPCVDAGNRRVYLANGGLLQVFDAATGSPLGGVPIPTAATGDWARSCIRWGTDGLAILGSGEIFVARSSLVVPGLAPSRAGGGDSPFQVFRPRSRQSMVMAME